MSDTVSSVDSDDPFADFGRASTISANRGQAFSTPPGETIITAVVTEHINQNWRPYIQIITKNS